MFSALQFLSFTVFDQATWKHSIGSVDNKMYLPTSSCDVLSTELATQLARSEGFCLHLKKRRNPAAPTCRLGRRHSSLSVSVTVRWESQIFSPPRWPPLAAAYHPSHPSSSASFYSFSTPFPAQLERMGKCIIEL